MIQFFANLWYQFKQPIKSIYQVYTNEYLFVAGLTFATIKAAFIRDHVVSWDITANIFLLVIIDTALGVWKHWKLNSLSSDGWGKLFTKIIIYWAFIKVVNAVAEVKYLSWCGDLFLSGLLIREAISIIENIGVIYPGLIPAWILKKLKGFDETGDFNNGTTTEKGTEG